MEIKDYTVEDKYYCYKGTDILKNKLNLQDKELLEKAERFITKFRQIDLEKNPIKGNFDLKHIMEIHKKIFSDIYEFAGKTRMGGLSKGSSQFCYPENIESEGEKIFEKLKRDNYLKGIEKGEFIDKLSELIGDLIALHPFREGNGRTNRTS